MEFPVALSGSVGMTSELRTVFATTPVAPRRVRASTPPYCAWPSVGKTRNLIFRKATLPPYS